MATAVGCKEILDDIRYSRQRYVLGAGAMCKLADSVIFLSGFGALGVEIAKNLVLAGIRKLTIHDAKIASEEDLQVNFCLHKTALGGNRVHESIKQLKELNPYVEIDTFTEPLELTSNFAFLHNFQCVILTETTLNVQIMVDEFCRSQTPSIKFVSADTFGILAWGFCDFGSQHLISDIDGEELKEAFVAHITKSDPLVITLLENQRHGFASGDVVTFSEIRGMEHLNGSTSQITMLSSSSFQIESIPGLGLTEYTGGGKCRQVKVQTSLTFESLSKQLHNPKFVDAKDNTVDTLTSHLAFLTLHAFFTKHDRWPRPWCEEDVVEFLEISHSIDVNFDWQVNINYDLMKCIASTANGILPPLCAFLGGVVAQEALKAVTAKFLPFHQVFYFNAADIVSDKTDINLHSMYSNRTSICIGNSAVASLQSLKAFMVGCGAIGCEMLKNLALLGVGTSNGLVTVTDHDLVEKSNLTRQFLFRNDSIQQSKSGTAAKAVKLFRPDMNVTTYQLKVGVETEEFFDDAFFKNQHVVISALDNVEGRRYLDRRCVKSCSPMLESGTMGTKGHVQVILPHLTESYSSQSDPVDDDIPYCTLKSFPTHIEHTIQWSRNKFESLFCKKPDILKNFEEARLSMEIILQKLDLGVTLDDAHKDMLEKMVCTLQVVLSQRPKHWAECLILARMKFEKYFNHKAKQLLHKFPLETKLSNGSFFWHSPRRPPTPIQFNIGNNLHIAFILSTARLLSSVWKIPFTDQDLSVTYISEILATSPVPEFIPNIKKHVETDDRIMPWMVNKDSADTDYETAVNQLRIALQQSFVEVMPQIFDKDDDDNEHIEFIMSASNLRAVMYGLETADKHVTRRIAGRIIPAIITTTSAIAGLLTLELIRLVKKSSRDKHNNCFLNLALSTFIFSEPAAAPVINLREDLKFTLWDKWEIRGHQQFTLQDFLKNIEDKYSVQATMVLQGTKIIYMPFLPGHSKKLAQLMTKLIIFPARGLETELSIGVEVGEDEKSGPPVTYYIA